MPVHQKTILVLDGWTPNNRISKIYEQKLIKLKGENRQIYNFSWKTSIFFSHEQKEQVDKILERIKYKN